VIFLAFIRAHDVSFSYAGKKPVIRNMNLRFNRGEFTAIMGPNGCGKTTLGKLMVGILKPVSGSIFINKKDITTMSLGEAGAQIGYLFQNPEFQIFATTVMEELTFILRLNDIDEDQIIRQVERVLSLLNLNDKRDSITFNLSYGEKQRLAIAGILLNKPDYLILDEPTTGLDIVRKEILLSTLYELLDEGIGMSVITHDEKFVKNFTGRLIKMNEGRVDETCIA
jgi:energy-coupling factor transport system ATP-binding protein